MIRFKLLIFCLFCIPLIGKELQPKKIAVCISAINMPPSSIQSLIESGRRHFCRLHEVHYFILGDSTLEMEGEDIDWIPMDRSSKPFKLYYSLQGSRKIFESYDYLFILNAQMVFVAPVGDEIFGELIAIQKEISTGKISIFSSALYGGKPAVVFDLLKTACRHIDFALSHPDGKKFNEELLINRCFKDCRPTRILTPSYAYPENWKLEYSKKIVITSP